MKRMVIMLSMICIGLWSCAGTKEEKPSAVNLLAAKETPKDIIDTIDQAIQQVIKDHEAFVVERMANVGQKLNYGGPEKYKTMLKSNNEMFSKILKGIAK